MLAEGRTLIRYDPRGSGLSDRNVDDFSLDAWIGDLEAVVNAAGLRRFPLIGLCQGGVVAAAYAARYPGRVSRLILYDSYLSGAYAAGAGEGLQKQAYTLAQMIDLGWGRDAGAFREVFANLLMPDATREQLRWIGELQRRSASATSALLSPAIFIEKALRASKGRELKASAVSEAYSAECSARDLRAVKAIGFWQTLSARAKKLGAVKTTQAGRVRFGPSGIASPFLSGG